MTVLEDGTSVGTAALSVAIFFYANRYLGWGLLQNSLLATGQGVRHDLGHAIAARAGSLVKQGAAAAVPADLRRTDREARAQGAREHDPP